ncbi:MAG: ABC transporter ATP-binding protein [Anaerolineae bacterium]|nr:ABC transporter ATP-binding protein [Anaerolineae bacterium]
MTPLLQARDVTKIFKGGLGDRAATVALKNFTLALDAEQPTIIAVVGESGSGKTTMGRMLLGLERPTTGEILYRGKNLLRLAREEAKQFRIEVQAIFQDPFGVYNSFYRVDHVLTVPIEKFGLAHNANESRAMIERALKAVGLKPEDTLGRYPNQLSGGQRQRIMIARALLLRPKVIIADEPVSMIDASLRESILKNLLQLKQEFGISIIYITHDLTTAYQISDSIIVLYRGEVVEQGGVELVNDPQHPYTKLLISSIPVPDPNRPWGEDEEWSQSAHAERTV